MAENNKPFKAHENENYPFYLRFLFSDKGLKFDKKFVELTGCSLLAYLYPKYSGSKPHSVLLLHSKGAKSGIKRSVVMPYLTIENQIYILGSKGGAPNDPFWVNNLRKEPQAEIKIHRNKKRVTAKILEGNKRAHIWEIAIKREPTYKKYQTLTKRLIPIVALIDRE